MKSKLGIILLTFLFLSLLMYANSVLIIQNHSVLEVHNPIQTIFPSNDAYVNNLHPDDDTGDDLWLWIAKDLSNVSIYETFIHFYLPSNYRLSGVIKLQFHVYLSFDIAFQVDFYRITQYWDEDTINWNNKPMLDEFLFTLELSHNKNYNINIKKYLTSNVFSICITTSYSQNNVVKIPSKENPWTESDEVLEIEIAPFDIKLIIGMILISIVGVLTIGNVGYSIYRRWNRMKSGQN